MSDKDYIVMHPDIWAELGPIWERWNGKYKWFWRPVMVIHGLLLRLSDWITGYEVWE